MGEALATSTWAAFLTEVAFETVAAVYLGAVFLLPAFVVARRLLFVILCEPGCRIVCLNCCLSSEYV
jgi:hypothetical protein